MKKGCFVKIIIVLTILIAVILYIAQNYMDELIINPGKSFIKELVVKDFKDKLENVKPTPEKDSLIAIFNNYLENKFEKINKLTIKNDNSEENIDNFVASINKFIEDSLVDQKDLFEIKKIVNEEVE